MTKSRIVCFVYTDTNRLHKTNEDVSKKNLYSFARLVCLNYEIGYKEENKYISIKKVKSIIKPRCMYISEESTKIHGITMEQAYEEGLEIEDVLETFIQDINNVSIIVSHNIEFHLKTILAELVRYNRVFNFKNYIIIDTIGFFHKLNYPKLDLLYLNLFKKNKELSSLNKIKKCFLKLYEDYELSTLN